MTPRLNEGANLRRLAALLGMSAISPGVASGQVVVPSATVSASGGYSTNPYQIANSSSGDAFAALEVAPNVAIITENGQVNVSGHYQRNQYTRSQNNSDSYGGSISGGGSLSSRTSVTASTYYDNARVGDGRNRLSDLVTSFPADAETAPTTAPGAAANTPPPVQTPIVTTSLIDPTLVDVGLVGLRQRRETLSGALGISFKPSGRDSWNAGASVTRSRYPGLVAGGSDYTSYGGSFGYSRSLSETSSVGARVSYYKSDYDTGINSSRVISPQLTYDVRLIRRWTISAAVGVSLTRSRYLIGTQSSTGIALDLSACRAGERTNFCLNANRSSTATGFGGVRPVTSVGVSYGYRLNGRSSISAALNYTRASNGSLVSGRSDYLSASAGYNRTISQRVSGFAQVQYQDVYSGNVSASANVTGRVGVSLKIGQLR